MDEVCENESVSSDSDDELIINSDQNIVETSAESDIDANGFSSDDIFLKKNDK